MLASHSANPVFARRSFIRSAVCAGLCAAATPALNLLSGPANAGSNWRGQVGCVKPTSNNSSLVDMIRLLPPGIGVVPIYLYRGYSGGISEQLCQLREKRCLSCLAALRHHQY